MISDFLNSPVVSKITNVIFEFIAEFGGGRGDLHDDLARFTIMGAMFFVAYLISKNTAQSNQEQDSYLTFGFLVGSVRALTLFTFTSTKLILIDVVGMSPVDVKYYFTFFQPTIEHTLNFICVGTLALSLMCYVTSNVEKAKEYIRQVCAIGLFSAIVTQLYIVSELLSSREAGCLTCLYWHGATFIIVVIPTLRLLRQQSSWLRNTVIVITSCWLFYDFVRILDILTFDKYTFYISPVRNSIYNFSIPIFVVIYLKELFTSLEYRTNEAKLLASDREFIIKGFSHEIRSPLMALSGFLKAYHITNTKYNNKLTEDARAKLKRGCPKGMFCNRIVEDGVPEMRLAVQYISNILDNLSEYGRDSSKHKIGKFELTSLTGVGVKYSKFTDEAKRIPSSSIICKPLDKDINVMISPSKYLQILQNLLRNSIRAVTMADMSKDKEPRIVVETILSADEKECAICVSDNGIGLTKKQIEACTNKYWTTKEDATRTNGLGLYFAKMYMEEFGGQLVIESNPGVGTNICLVFKVIA